MKQLATMRVVGEDAVEPHPAGVIKAFARIGYKLSEAIADIVDNSVDAGATNILIRFFCTDSAIRQVAIADDGSGMTEARLLQAMQFGTDMKHAATDLGKFGIGLKSASFSQCRKLSVVSRQRGKVAGRRWTVESIRAGWRCERLHVDDASQLLDASWGEVCTRRQGTIVLWDELDRLHVPPGDHDSAIRKIFKQLNLALGLVYHRFLQKKKLSIKLDAVRYGEDMPGVARPVLPIDPFSYVASGNKHYPKIFKVRLGSHDLRLHAHIWPARSKGPEYSLGGKAAARQGFYFYRNDRLIQAGGWNNLREHETDPHLSLARVAVDLPTAMDALFHLDVQKASLDVPAEFDAAVKKSRAGGVSWGEYLRDAEHAYRRADRKNASPKDSPLILGGGVPPLVRARAKKAFHDGGRETRRVKVKWATLPPDVFFDIDRTNLVIKINKRFQRSVVNGRAKSQDGALTKALLFLLLRDEFNRERVRRGAQEWLDHCNDVLLATISDTER